jgi:hypothetical protein
LVGLRQTKEELKSAETASVAALKAESDSFESVSMTLATIEAKLKERTNELIDVKLSLAITCESLEELKKTVREIREENVTLKVDHDLKDKGISEFISTIGSLNNKVADLERISQNNDSLLKADSLKKRELESSLEVMAAKLSQESHALVIAYRDIDNLKSTAAAETLQLKDQLQSERIRLESELKSEMARLDASFAMDRSLETKRLETFRLEKEQFELSKQEFVRLESIKQEALRVVEESLKSEQAILLEDKQKLARDELEFLESEARRLDSILRQEENLEAQRLESDRLKAERFVTFELEKEQIEASRQALNVKLDNLTRIEDERLEAERLEEERKEIESIEAQRMEALWLEEERLESEIRESEKVLLNNAIADLMFVKFENETLIADTIKLGSRLTSSGSELAKARSEFMLTDHETEILEILSIEVNKLEERYITTGDYRLTLTDIANNSHDIDSPLAKAKSNFLEIHQEGSPELSQLDACDGSTSSSYKIEGYTLTKAQAELVVIQIENETLDMLVKEVRKLETRYTTSCSRALFRGTQRGTTPARGSPIHHTFMEDD